jgi:hypothetical protein
MDRAGGLDGVPNLICSGFASLFTRPFVVSVPLQHLKLSAHVGVDVCVCLFELLESHLMSEQVYT